MANKSLKTRQKLTFRVDAPSLSKPRNPVALAAKQRAAGSHEKTGSAKRQMQRRLTRKLQDTDK
ncbi:MAG: hypothetical protein K0S28_933 [Paucimonas sp.]|jgi:hypothetical protein|nr:hypothetical protein [Paucimonas sp.]